MVIKQNGYYVEYSDDGKILVRCASEYEGDFVIPDSVTEIDSGAFKFCEYLTGITIPSSVKVIGSAAFESCFFAKGKFINNSILDAKRHKYWHACIFDEEREDGLCIKGDVLVKCRRNSKAVSIPNHIKYIRRAAFVHCLYLTHIDIPDSVIFIGNATFCNCRKLASVTIPRSVTMIEDNIFIGCESLENVTVDKDNPKYDSRDNCNAVIETKTNTLLTCCDCTVIPASVTAISTAAFTDIKNIGRVVVDERNPKYDSRDNCNAIIDTATNTLIKGCKNTKIPDTVTSIGDDAFCECNDLEYISIPESVTAIGKEAFYKCRSLMDICVHTQCIGSDQLERLKQENPQLHISECLARMAPPEPLSSSNFRYNPNSSSDSQEAELYYLPF